MAKAQREGWSVVFKSGTDYGSELVRDRLVDAGIPAVILNHRDHAWNLTHGYLAKVRVLVPDEFADAAEQILAGPGLTDEELAEIALKGASTDRGQASME